LYSVLDAGGLAISKVAISPDNRYVAALDLSNSLWVFDVNAGVLLRSATFARPAAILKFFPNSDRLLLASESQFTIVPVVPQVAGLSDTQAIVAWAYGKGFSLVADEDRRRYALGVTKGEAAGPWAAIDPNSEDTANVVWGTSQQDVSDKAMAACRKVSTTCSSRPATTKNLDDTFVYMCCTRPQAGCAVSPGSGDATLRSLKVLFLNAGYSDCAVRAAFSARDGSRR